jgi:FKBP-type peptidyl-prolyl cis-trans isomerase
MFSRKSHLGWIVGGGVLVVLLVGVGSYFLFWAKPSSQRARVSYTIGAQFGRSLKTQNLDLDAGAIARGMKDGLQREDLVLTENEMQTALMKLNEERQKDIRETAERNKSISEEFLARNGINEGVKSTSSGLQYKIQNPGTGVMPKFDDVVVVTYRGTLTDGKEFDSSFRRNQPAEFPVRGVIPGWSEGLQLMKKGGKATFYIPPELGYGDSPRQNIPPNSVLVFEVELLNVKPSGTVPDKSPSAHNPRPILTKAEPAKKDSRTPSSKHK